MIVIYFFFICLKSYKNNFESFSLDSFFLFFLFLLSIIKYIKFILTYIISNICYLNIFQT